MTYNVDQLPQIIEEIRSQSYSSNNDYKPVKVFVESASDFSTLLAEIRTANPMVVEAYVTPNLYSYPIIAAFSHDYDESIFFQKIAVVERCDFQYSLCIPTVEQPQPEDGFTAGDLLEVSQERQDELVDMVEQYVNDNMNRNANYYKNLIKLAKNDSELIIVISAETIASLHI
jgi:hypothetical protein